MFVRKMLVTAIAATLSTSAFAEAPADGNRTLVQIGDLDLTQIRDQKRLHNRIERAASRVCRSPMRGVAAAIAEEPCIKVAIASAQHGAERAIALANQATRIASLEIGRGD